MPLMALNGARQELMNTLDSVKLICCIGVGEQELYSPALLHHFVHYYLGLGILPENFLLTLHAPSEEQNLGQATDYLGRFNIKASDHLLGEHDCYKFYDQNYKLMARCSAHDWIILVDFDEFLVVPASLPEFVREIEASGCNLVMGVLVDRLAPNGRLTPIKVGSPIWDQFPEKFKVTRDIVKGFDQKTCIFRNVMQPNLGHHLVSKSTVPIKVFSQVLNVHHFKWDVTLPTRLKKSLERFRKNPARYWWAGEVERLLARITDDHLSLTDCDRID